MGSPTYGDRSRPARGATVVPLDRARSARATASDADEVRRRYLRHGALVPPAHTVDQDASASWARALAAADQLAARSLATSTRKAYGRHVEAWLDWAEERGVSVLPADPRHVAAFLTEYSLELDEHGKPVLDEGEWVGLVAPVSTGQRLVAINELHKLAGFPTPGSAKFVGQMMSGLRKSLGTAPTGAKAAITWDKLEQMLACVSDPPLVLRRRALRALHEATGATPGQLARLEWPDVTGEGEHLEVSLPAARARGPREVVGVRATGSAGCPVAAVAAWRLASTSWPGISVFKDAAGRPVSRQAIHKTFSSPARSESGVPGDEHRRVRDRAILLAGWASSQRRSNLSALNWDQVSPNEDGGWTWYLKRSKTDQEARGRTAEIPPAPDGSGLSDPAQALSDWLEVVRDVLGFDPRTVQGIPVFCRLDKHGTIQRDGQRMRRLSGAGINDVVQRYADLAGLVAPLSATGSPIVRGKPFGAHSLRAGFVTEGLQRGVAPEKLQGQTGHKSIDSLLVYDRPALRRSQIASRLVLEGLAQQSHGDDAEKRSPASSGPSHRQRPRVDWNEFDEKPESASSRP